MISRRSVVETLNDLQRVEADVVTGRCFLFARTAVGAPYRLVRELLPEPIVVGEPVIVFGRRA